MNKSSSTIIFFAFAVLFLAMMACQSYAPIDPAILESEDLSGQNFGSKSLAFLDLSDKDLRDANFSGANCEGTNFSDSDLRGATFNGTILVGADFTNATLDERWIPIIELLTTLNGAGQNFSGVDLNSTYLPTANLSNADLSSANLSRAQLPNANLAQADLIGANLRSTNLIGAIFNNADLTGVRVSGLTDLSFATLSGATISEDALRVVKLFCTRMPDGSIYDEASCNGTPPPP
jgi:uncharacterized protein YjbI with pentapeptide repeats